MNRKHVDTTAMSDDNFPSSNTNNSVDPIDDVHTNNFPLDSSSTTIGNEETSLPNKEEIQNQADKFQFDTLQKKIQKCVLEFSLALHNNDNFSRKDVSIFQTLPIIS